MTRICADDPQTTAPLHGAAVHADLLYRSFHLHDFEVLYSSGYSRSATVGIKLHLHFIPDENLDSVQTHLSGEVRQYNISCRQSNPKQRIRKRLFYDALDNLWFSHICTKDSNSVMQKSQGLEPSIGQVSLVLQR